MLKRLVFALAALTATPAFAQDDPGGPPELWKAAGEDTKVALAEGFPTSNLILLGDIAIILNDTTIQDVSKYLGVPIRHRGDASASLDWVCLHVDGKAFDTRVWFESDEVNGDTISGMTQQRMPASARPSDGCDAAKIPHQPIDIEGAPIRIGQPEAEIRAALHNPTWDAKGVVGFTSFYQLALPEPPGPCQISRALWVKFEKNAVAAFNFSASTYC